VLLVKLRGRFGPLVTIAAGTTTRRNAAGNPVDAALGEVDTTSAQSSASNMQCEPDSRELSRH
jgi:hypothetical protein